MLNRGFSSVEASEASGSFPTWRLIVDGESIALLRRPDIGDLPWGDLGVDVFSDREVADIVFEQWPYTLVLVLAAIGGATLLGIPLGCFSAIRRNSLLDRITAVMSVAFIAIPSFVVALYLLLWLAVKWRWFPAMGPQSAST